MNIRQLIVILILMTLSGCKHQSEIDVPPPLPTGEKLWSHQILTKSLMAEVTSNGCTHSADFQLHQLQGDGIIYIWLTRERQDMCRKKPFRQSIELKLPERLQNQQLQLINPVVN